MTQNFARIGILAKHKLFTDLNLDMVVLEPEKSNAFEGYDAAVCGIVHSLESFKFQLNPEITNISYGLFSNMITSIDIPAGKFNVGNYTLNKKLDEVKHTNTNDFSN